MSMNLEKQTFSTKPDYLIADGAEINTAVKTASVDLKRGAVVAIDSDGKLASVSTKTTGSGETAVTAVDTTGLYGIVADDVLADEDAVVYLTGGFFKDALVLPEGCCAEDVEIALRNLGIFLK